MNEDNKRIAKNTLTLYARFFINLAIGIFTGRVILDALGESDYGVYNVVGGFVGLFTLISGPVSGAISRFVVFALGKGDIDQAKKIFSTSILVMYAISAIIVVAAESFGIWFIDNKMVIPSDRLLAAHWVFQISLFDMVVSLTMAPYIASFVSHEKFGIDTVLATIATFLRLGICFAIMYTSSDKLILYAVLLLCISLAQRMVYRYYCKRHFEECHYKLRFHKDIFKGIFSFAGWNAIGSSAALLRSQGGNILLNLFGGPAVNAAAGVCGTIVGLVTSFSGNFTTAASPQITKSYAAEDHNHLKSLLIRMPKFGFFILLFFTLPVLLNADWLLNIWLVKVPDHTVNFIRLLLIYQLIEVLSRPLIDAKNATGNIRNYQIVVGGILLLSLPISYMALKNGAPVEAIYVVNIIISFFSLWARLYMLRGDIVNFSSMLFIRKVVLRVFIVAIISSVLPVTLYLFMDYGFVRVLITSLLSVITTLLSVLYIGCVDTERDFFKDKIKSVFNKVFRVKNA